MVPESRPSDSTVTGVVLAAQANFYRVRLGVASDLNPKFSPESAQDILCTRRSRLKKLGQQVLVGDRVKVSIAGERGVIESVIDRRSYLSRPPIANVEQVLVIFAVAEPPLDPVQLSRFLVQAETSGLPVYLCLNKCDLISPKEHHQWQQRLQAWGYAPIFLSAKEGIGLERLAQICQERISVVMGLSGVGKSTLLNALVPGLKLATQAVSGRLQHGRHTTRHVELFPLKTQQTPWGWIADSPGFNQADLQPCQVATLIQCFPEVRSRISTCQFRDCLHQQEPGCQIRTWNWERYPIYLSFLQEVMERESSEQESADPEDVIKFKSTAKGKDHPDGPEGRAPLPRLSPQHRHRSRRQRRQRTQQWTGDVTEIIEAEDEPREA